MTTPGSSRRVRPDKRAVFRLSRIGAASLYHSVAERVEAEHPPTERRSTRQKAAVLWKKALRWLGEFLRHLFARTRPLPPLPPGDAGRYRLPARFTLGLAADWGSGTSSAYAVADAMSAMQPDVTIHLGDVYFSGTADEYDRYFLPPDCWPRGRLGDGGARGDARGTYVLNANHEMYSGGEGYFERGLSGCRQATSYFCLENEYWRLVGLDTGYHCTRKLGKLLSTVLGPLKPDSTRLPDANVAWLRQGPFADDADDRPTILLSHHQPYSAFKTEVYPSILAPLAPYLPRVLLWFWGHEHRLALYARSQAIRGRCIGHGGIPYDVPFAPVRSDPRVVIYDDRESPERVDGETVGLNGFVLCAFDGPSVTVRYYDEQCGGDRDAYLIQETWRVAGGAPAADVQLGPRGGGLRVVGDLAELCH